MYSNQRPCGKSSRAPFLAEQHQDFNEMRWQECLEALDRLTVKFMDSFANQFLVIAWEGHVDAVKAKLLSYFQDLTTGFFFFITILLFKHLVKSFCTIRTTKCANSELCREVLQVDKYLTVSLCWRILESTVYLLVMTSAKSFLMNS